MQAALAGLKAARTVGVKTVFNMQVGLSTMNNMGISRKDILSSLSLVDVFAPCREGLYELAGTTDLVKARDFLRQYCDGILLFTLGDHGSVSFDRDNKQFSVPIHHVTPVDTTSAGDSYIGAFIWSYLLENHDLEKSMVFATDCAAYTCSGLGARYSPTLQQIRLWIGREAK